MSVKLLKKIDLKKYNTLKISALANELYIIRAPEDIVYVKNMIESRKCPIVLGSGSNVVFQEKDIQRPIILNQIKGINIEDKSTNQIIYIKAGAGEIWDDFVDYTINRSWLGLENLALIPGTVGAAPVQNIGAYGVEVSEFIDEIHYFDLIDRTYKCISAQSCEFRYRDSIFKQSLKNRAVILSVTFKFRVDHEKHELKMSYRGVDQAIKELGYHKNTMSARQLAHTIRRIRKQKLPHPDNVANVGSFFKNPSVSNDHYHQLLIQHPQLNGFKLDNHSIKLSAAQLIEYTGWKGKRMGDAGVSDQHALVLVNHGHATGQEILQLAKHIRCSVMKEFGVDLNIEPIIICNDNTHE